MILNRKLTLKARPASTNSTMVSTRAKIRKTRNALKNYYPKKTTTDSYHQLTSSAERIGSNDDLLTEILHRLPVTSILQFKSVSKHWWWLLSHRSFTLRYDKFPISPGLFVHNKYVPYDVEDRSPPPYQSLDFCPDLNGIKIVQSCNGLLLCCCDRGHIRDHKYYVFNPTTKQFAIIPSVPGDDDARKSIRFMGLAFHQTTCPRYKAVCILGSAGIFVIQIYFSETGKWKTVNNYFSENPYARFGSGVYWNGAIHWNPSGGSLFYFDLNSEELRTLPLPLPVQARMTSLEGDAWDAHPPIYFGESRGHLHMVDTTCHGTRFHLNVYEMLGDHSGWFAKFEVGDDLLGCYPDIIRNYPYGLYCGFVVIDVVRGIEDEDTFLVLKYFRKILRYNVRDKSFKWLTNMTTDFEVGRHGRREIHPYIQRLASF
ncbi:F-box protein At5g07610-like [Bidens hawaiensis]|uniref:F-box protein At5g07610-like n=1 Tax=Bidens hawaiensis TaxID=980011 RepID=UPI0040499F78